MILAPKPTREEAFAFNESISDEKINSSRVIMALGSMLLIIYTLMDSFGLPPETLAILYPIRAASISLLCILFGITYKKDFFIKHYVALLMSGYISVGIIITIGVYISQASDYSYDGYFAALMIYVITSFSWSYIPIKISMLNSLVFVAAYFVIKVYFHQDLEGTRPLAIATQMLYIFSILIVASIAQYIRDNLIYKNLRLQKKLKVIALEKSIEAEEQERLANLDSLTGIPNRRAITKKINNAIKIAEEDQSLLIFIFMDLNGFKNINDTYGHDSGDKVLEVTARRLERTIRKNDCIARIGGDEFLLAFNTDQFSANFVHDLTFKLKGIISAPIVFNKNKLQVGVSMGVATYPRDGLTVEELIRFSDKEMYKDKHQSRKVLSLA